MSFLCLGKVFKVTTKPNACVRSLQQWKLKPCAGYSNLGV